jgi:hypothetical protein
MGTLGGVERTLPQLKNLLEKSGWKLVRVHNGPPYVLSSQKAIAIPA